MLPKEAIRAVIEMVPNWYECAVGPETYSLEAAGHKVHFWGHRRPTPLLWDFLQCVRRELDEILEDLGSYSSSIGVDLLQEHFARSWLEIAAPGVAWGALIDFSRQCLNRTYENDEICFNIIVGEGEGEELVTDPSIQKIFDPLASSNRTYLRVDRDLRLFAFEQVEWNRILEPPDYRFYPEFLHPFVSVLEPGEIAVHQTRRGDFIVMNEKGLLAAKRKGRWKLYDVETLKNSITEAVGSYRVGANLFEILFDLSFKRHGALLVYDPGHCVVEDKVANPASIFGEHGSPDLARRMLRRSVEAIALGQADRSRYRKQLFLELAGIDGALIFDEEALRGVGSMVRTHPDVPGEVGARTTAARSAYLYGAHPIKISSDGEITVFFESEGRDGTVADAELVFL